MIDQAIIKLLTDTGHLHYPFGKRVVGVVHDVSDAIRSYQDFTSPTLDALCLKHHGRPLQCDGEPGPATHELWAQPRCGCCDYQAAQAIQPVQGSGNWKGCHEIGDFHAATVYIDDSNMPSFLNDGFVDVWNNTVAAYDAIGLRWLRTDDKSEANTIVSWERGRGWIGLAIVGQGQSCGSRIWAKFDTGYNPAKTVRMWSGLFIHELGHNAGLNHTRGGIMNPYLLDGPASWENDPSLVILRRKYGGLPVGGGGEDPEAWTLQGLKSNRGREVWSPLSPPRIVGEDD